MRTTLGQLAESLNRSVQTIPQTEAVSAAVEKMKSLEIGALVVLDDAGDVAGMFSERDVLTRVVADHRDPQSTKVSEVMTPGPKCVESNTTVEGAMRMVVQEHIRHLPLINEGKLQDVISSRDLMSWAIGKQKEEIESLGHKLRSIAQKNLAVVAIAIAFVILAIIAMLTF